MHIKVAHHLFSDTTFRRGHDYFNWGLVLTKPQKDAHVYEFVVVGTKHYHTNITVDDVGHLLSAHCDCQGKRYCKHLAASFIVLSHHKKDDYQIQPYLNIPDDFNEYVMDVDQQVKEVIGIMKLALNHAQKHDDTDVLFEAYEFYMDQMDWYLNNHHDQTALTLFSWMMDEFISYWTSANNDCIDMDFFAKQTLWIDVLVHHKIVSPEVLIEEVRLWLALYPEIPMPVINDWLTHLSQYAKEEVYRVPLQALFNLVKERDFDEHQLVEAYYFLAKHSNVFFPYDVIDVNAYPKIVYDLVEKAMANFDYESALPLIKTQIQDKPKYEDIPWTSLWVMISELTEQEASLKEALRWLFYCGEINGYHQLKAMIDRRDWKAEVDVMLHEHAQGRFSDWTYRQLLVLEQRWDLLKAHVQDHPWFISQLNRHLIDVEPEFVYQTLRQWIKDRYREFKDERGLRPWIVLFSSYFSEAEGYQLLEEIKKESS